jgi:hypothetical protein
VQRYRKNAERNLTVLAETLGLEAVRDVFEALERAVVATAPLENPAVARAAIEGAEVEADPDESDDEADVEESVDDVDSAEGQGLQAAE